MTRSPRIACTPDGRAYLHIWRTGKAYARQKERLYRLEWTNLLFSMQPQPADSPDIFHHDVRRSLPFAEQTFDAAYAMHIVEHLTPDEARSFVKELSRVLKPGGIVRISTPDLEDICRSYLRQLDESRANRSEQAILRYRWAVFELLDQLVREQTGGLMSEACARGDFDREFALERFGDVFDEFAPPSRPPTGKLRTGLVTRLLHLTPASLVDSVRWRLADLLDPRRSGSPNEPRRSGELNKWMYDELSLEMLLEAGGFRDRRRQDYRSSIIPNWNRYALDQSTHGPHPIEPSLYFEAVKPCPAGGPGARM